MLKINECFYRLQGKDMFVQKKHLHNEIEFIHVINGNGLVLKNGRTFRLESQHIYVIDARNTHLVYPKPDNCNDYIRNKLVIDADSFMEFYTDLGMESVLNALFDSSPVTTLENPEVDRIYKQIFDLYRKKGEYLGFAHGYITELIHWIYTNTTSNKKYDSKNTIQRMVDIINKKEGLTSLEEISKILYMNKYYLCHLFKEKTGITLSEYISDILFEKCCTLLRNTPYSVEKISTLCGFSSSASLIRFLKKKCGISPSRYRKDKEFVINQLYNKL